MALISGSQTITTANLTDLLDGGPSTLHTHASAEHGASDHTNITRTIWMTPGPVHTSATYLSLRLPAYRMGDSAQVTVVFGFQVPVDYYSHSASTAIRLVWANDLGGTANMYGRFESYGNVEGATYESMSEVGAEQTMASAGNKLINVTTNADSLDLSGLQIGDFVGVQYRRSASHANDTINSYVYVFGMLFTYTALQ